MYRIGYARGGLVTWERLDLVMGVGEPFGWADTDVRSPSVIDAAGYTLMAYEAWSGGKLSGVDFALSRDGWLEPAVDQLIFEEPGAMTLDVKNEGVGNLYLLELFVLGRGFELQKPFLPVMLKPNQKISLPVTFVGGDSGEYRAAIVLRSSDMVHSEQIVDLTGYY